MSESTFGFDNAFPDETESGLTKRELFAMAAMAGMLASDAPFTSELGEDSDTGFVVSIDAVRYADSLIDALNEVILGSGSHRRRSRFTISAVMR